MDINKHLDDMDKPDTEQWMILPQENVSDDVAVGDFIWSHPVLSTIDITYLVICIIWGTVGNLIILAVIIKSKNFHKRSYIFVAQLATADFINAIFVMPLILANVMLGANAAGDTLCQVGGVVIIFTCGLSVYSIVMIAFQRYLTICQSAIHQRMFRPCHIVVMVTTMWIFCALCATPPLFGWSEIQYNKEQYLCGYSRDAAYSYNVFIFVTGIIIPAVVIAFCYWRIFREMNKTRGLLASISNSNSRVNATSTNNVKRATKTMVIITVTFAVCCGPYGVLIVADYHDTLPGIVHKIAAFVGLGNSCLNSIIVLTRSKEFRKACKVLVPQFVCGIRLRRRSSHSSKVFAMTNSSTNI